MQFYDNVYRPFSRAAHQSYDYVEREADNFVDVEHEKGAEQRLLLILSVLTFALLHRVKNDVGSGDPAA